MVPPGDNFREEWESIRKALIMLYNQFGINVNCESSLWKLMEAQFYYYYPYEIDEKAKKDLDKKK